MPYRFNFFSLLCLTRCFAPCFTLKGDCVHEVEAALRHAQPLPRVARAAAERDRWGHHAGEHAEGARHGDQGPAGPGLPQVARSPGRQETDARGAGEHRRPGAVRYRCHSGWGGRQTQDAYGLLWQVVEKHYASYSTLSL